MTPTPFDRKALLQTILDQFRLDRDGDHGPVHWSRVSEHAKHIQKAYAWSCSVSSYSDRDFGIEPS